MIESLSVDSYVSCLIIMLPNQAAVWKAIYTLFSLLASLIMGLSGKILLSTYIRRKLEGKNEINFSIRQFVEALIFVSSKANF